MPNQEMLNQEMTEQEAMQVLRRMAGRSVNQLSRRHLQQLLLAQNALLRRYAGAKFEMRLVMVQD